ncbi:TadE/TadG family type IV pilus assembly protein [Devosia ginsengisoli]|uniref:TadE/TadG family type IV pilus assembly protein n=1 Tax=Devosia ginsengisoli TaxID=400770 RepID=UPI0026EC9BBB|nr:TadE/TadG family type IV pilus assembly protein [Devosia ginsengisoli]MCR6670260.1 pilus assembly protein [Devosia ginsengisoli]
MAHLRRLAVVEEATAAVEFALILPIMLLVYVGSVEASIAITTDRKVQSVAGALGDLVARSDTTIPMATLLDYFQAAEGIMTPYPTSELLQTVTQVRVLSDGTASVVWSWQYEHGNMGPGAHEAGSAFSLPGPMTTIARDDSKPTYVIVSEGSYSHTPLFGFIFNQPINLYRENFLMPRFGGNITVN